MRTVQSMLVVALMCIVALVSCGPQQVNVNPQAAVAHYASDIAQALVAYQTVVVKATETTPPLLTVAQATPRMNEIRKGLDAGQRLATLLRQYDSLAAGSPDRAGVVAQIQTTLSALSGLGLDAATLPAQLVAQGTQLVLNVTNIIASAKAAVATGGM